jgi:heterodisulfide reductase subunit A-like polyferredoxin
MGSMSLNNEVPEPIAGDGSQGIMDTAIENFRPMSVIVIGAGFSGIYCGVRIPERLRNVKLTIYEKNAGVGGTWYENRYPGCACDIPGE